MSKGGGLSVFHPFSGVLELWSNGVMEKPNDITSRISSDIFTRILYEPEARRTWISV
jgi:hypothetical protein